MAFWIGWMIVGARCFSLCWGTLCSIYGWFISYKYFGGIVSSVKSPTLMAKRPIHGEM